MEWIIKEGFENMDFARVTDMLARSYWVKGIGREEVERAASNSSLVIGIFTPEGRQVAFLRAVSDKTRFAYIMDVYVDEDYRRQGIGKRMIEHMLAHPEYATIYQWMLVTRDAHEVYADCGFRTLTRPLDWMELRRPRDSAR